MSTPQPLTTSESAVIGRERDDARPGFVALPRMLTPFLGRHGLVDEVVARVGDPTVRLLTLTGPGGVGKTRLALRVAEVARPLFPDGTHFVSLAPVDDPALVLPTVGLVLGLSDGGDRPIAERLAAALDGRRTLLVLDNLEQVLEAAPELGRLLRATSGPTVLATSRAPLRIDGEHELSVPPLALPPARRQGAAPVEQPEAVRFFLERARAVNPNLALTPAGGEAVNEIVRRLDGLPLALELAAARTKVLSPEGLLLRLERQLHVLTGGPQDRPARQRTMRDAIAWSYGLVDPPGRALFRSLAVFRGGFSLVDAEAVLGDHLQGADQPVPDILDGVASLVDQSLLTVGGGGGSEDRFRMLETIREFALEQLAAAGEADAVWRAFAGHWTDLAEATWAHAAELDALNRAVEPLERNYDNIRAALDWLEVHDPAGAGRLTWGLTWFWYLRGHIAETSRRVGRLISFPASVMPPLVRARVLALAGKFAHFQGDTAAAVPLLSEALAAYRSLGDEWGMGDALRGLGMIAEDTGAYDHAGAPLEEAVKRLSLAGDDAGVASARYHLAVVTFGEGDLDGADALLDQALGGPYGLRVRVADEALHLRGLVAHERGDAAGALGFQQEALRRCLSADNLLQVPDQLAGVAVSIADALPIEAVRLWAVAERLTEELGGPFRLPERMVYEASVAELRARLGEPAFAAAYADGRALPEDAAVAAALALDLPTGAPSATGAPPAGPLDVLSAREREVLRLVANGWTSDRIADELFLSPRTVHAHLANIYRKLGVENRAEAVRVAVDAGLT